MDAGSHRGSMKVDRFLSFGFLCLSCCFSAQAFQISKSSPKRTTTEQTAQRIDQELEKYRSAAETFQLSGDLENARVQNEYVVSIGLRRLANLSIREGQSKRAVETLHESVTVRDSSDARTGLAVVHMQLGDLDEGIRQAQLALELDPRNAEAQDVLGKLFYLKADYESARPWVERTLGNKPGFDSAYTLGMTYLQLKKLDRVKLLFEEMLGAVAKKASMYVILGRAYEETNFPAEAEREFRNAIKADPAMAGAHFYLGFTILQHGGGSRLDEAGREFDLELRRAPLDPYTNFLAGVTASSLGDHARAVRYLQAAVRVKPDFGPAYLFLGQSQVEMGFEALAEKSLRKAIELNGEARKNSFQIRRTYFLLGRLLIKQGRKAEGDKYLDRAREIQDQMLESARDDIRRVLGDVVSSAMPGSSSALQRAPQAPKSLPATESAALRRTRAQISSIVAQAYHNLAVIEQQNGRTEESLAKFAAAAKWQPDFPGLDRNWGIVSFRVNQFDKGIGPLSRHLKLQPDDSLARRMLGLSYYFTKNYRSAVETLKPIAATLPGDPELAYFYGISLVHLDRHAEASVVFEKIALRKPETAQAQFYAGQGYVLTGNFEKAVSRFRHAGVLDPKMEGAHYNAGQALIRLNRLEEAEKEFRAELQLDPLSPFAKYHLAYTLLERNLGIDEAIRLLKEGIDTKYDFADARYQLGKALIARGEVEEALQQLQTAANLEPKKEYIHYQLSIAYRRASRIEEADRALKAYSDLKAQNRNANPANPGNRKNEP